MKSLIKKSFLQYFSPLFYLRIAYYSLVVLVVHSIARKRFKTRIIPSLPKCYTSSQDLIEMLSSRILSILNAASEEQLEQTISFFSFKQLQQLHGFYQNKDMMKQLLCSFVMTDVVNLLNAYKMPKIRYTADLCYNFIDDLIDEDVVDTTIQHVIAQIGVNEQYNPLQVITYLMLSEMQMRISAITNN